jgi:hypothetical protein
MLGYAAKLRIFYIRFDSRVLTLVLFLPSEYQKKMVVEECATIVEQSTRSPLSMDFQY